MEERLYPVVPEFAILSATVPSLFDCAFIPDTPVRIIPYKLMHASEELYSLPSYDRELARSFTKFKIPYLGYEKQSIQK